MSQDSPSSPPAPPTPAAETPQAETPQTNHQPLPNSQPQANGDAPPIYVPGSFQPPYREPFGPTSPLTVNQCKGLLAIVKQIKRAREAVPFNTPVDPIAFNIPHYTNIIHKPMDLGTVETKLNASNPALPKDKNRPVKKDMSQGTYANVQEVVEGVRQIWNNTRIFNGPQHAVSLNADKLDEQFETAIKKAKLGEETSGSFRRSAYRPRADFNPLQLVQLQRPKLQHSDGTTRMKVKAHARSVKFIHLHRRIRLGENRPPIPSERDEHQRKKRFAPSARSWMNSCTANSIWRSSARSCTPSTRSLSTFRITLESSKRQWT